MMTEEQIQTACDACEVPDLSGEAFNALADLVTQARQALDLAAAVRGFRTKLLQRLTVLQGVLDDAFDDPEARTRVAVMESLLFDLDRRIHDRQLMSSIAGDA